MRVTYFWCLAAAGAACSACGVPGFSSRPAVSIPEADTGQTKCQIAANHENPLVTEWPASEKANLEARLAQGAVVVAYSGCSLRILPSCRVTGGYAFRRTTLSTDVIEIDNADELYAKLPLGALSLEGELQRRGRLAVRTTVAGQLGLTAFDAASFPKDDTCTGATHVVRALSVGAFTLQSGGLAAAHGGASLAGVGSGKGSSSTEERLVREAGVPARCEQGTDAAPHADCSSPIQIFLEKLPTSITDRGPTGMMKAKFLPVESSESWDVVVGDRKVCTTPCERWVDPGMPYTFKNDPGFWQRNRYVEVPDLRTYLPHDHVEVRARPQRTGEFVGGIVLTSLAGMAAVAGTALTAVGCSKDGSGLCTAGLITLPVGVLGTVPGIWMMLDSAGEARVTPVESGGH